MMDSGNEHEPAPDIIAAHRHSIRHRSELRRSTTCGCFYCCELFAPGQVAYWVDENAIGEGQTALCPHCRIDSVIGDASGFLVTSEFLARMEAHWFGLRSESYWCGLRTES